MTLKVQNQSGVIYGYLKIIEDFGYQEYGAPGKTRRFVLAECLRCNSSTKKYLLSTLRSGSTVSCGCFRSLSVIQRTTSHGKSRTRTYRIWNKMKDRCLNKNHKHYPSYGGRGIKVCSEWMNFEGFYSDMGNAPEALTLDRINVNGDYEPKNCRWANETEQKYNQRKSPRNTSGRTGVYFSKTGQYWYSSIRINKKTVGLGSFKTFEEAVNARQKAEIEVFGYNKQ